MHRLLLGLAWVGFNGLDRFGDDQLGSFARGEGLSAQFASWVPADAHIAVNVPAAGRDTPSPVCSWSFEDQMLRQDDQWMTGDA